MDIIIENLSIGYKDKTAVATDINVTFRGGRLSCLIGENGAGKSTLLKTISGFLLPQEGNIVFGDKPLKSMSHSQMARMVSIVLTGNSNIQNMTVEETIGLGRSPYTGFFGVLTAKDKEIVADATTKTGIDDLAKRMMQTLSDGERQKVMIARALAQQTPIILLDEPTAFLDYPSKAGTMALLQRLAHSEGKTIILSTHDLELATRFGDDFYLMEAHHLNVASRENIIEIINSTKP